MSRFPAWQFGAPLEDFAGKLKGPRAREKANDCIAMTAWGQSRRLEDVSATSRHNAPSDKLCRRKAAGADDALSRSSLSLRQLRDRHHDLGEETFATQRKETPFDIAQHRLGLVSKHRGGRR
jgi:hypothetical protein